MFLSVDTSLGGAGPILAANGYLGQSTANRGPNLPRSAIRPRLRSLVRSGWKIRVCGAHQKVAQKRCKSVKKWSKRFLMAVKRAPRKGVFPAFFALRPNRSGAPLSRFGRFLAVFPQKNRGISPICARHFGTRLGQRAGNGTPVRQENQNCLIRHNHPILRILWQPVILRGMLERTYPRCRARILAALFRPKLASRVLAPRAPQPPHSCYLTNIH